MAGYDGSGNFTVSYPSFQYNSVISETEVNTNNADIATGLSTAITKDGQTTITANIPFSNHKLTGLGAGTAATDSLTLGQAQAQGFLYAGTAGGTANALTLTLSPAITAYALGLRILFKASSSTNTGAVTVDVNSVGATAVQNNGAALAGGEIAPAGFYELLYDGTQFQLSRYAANPFAPPNKVIYASHYADIDLTGATVSTTGMQRFVDDVVTNQALGILDGKVLIDAALQPPCTTASRIGWAIQGISNRGAEIKQQTNGKPIFAFPFGNFCDGWSISHMHLTWSNDQNTTNDSGEVALAIAFGYNGTDAISTADDTSMAYFSIADLTISEGRGIGWYDLTANTGIAVAWAYTIERINFALFAGPAFRFKNGGTGGAPNAKFDHITIDIRDISLATDGTSTSLFEASRTTEIAIKNLEYYGAAGGSTLPDTGLMSINTTGVGGNIVMDVVKIENLKFEDLVGAGSSAVAFTFTNTDADAPMTLRLGGIDMQSATINTSTDQAYVCSLLGSINAVVSGISHDDNWTFTAGDLFWFWPRASGGAEPRISFDGSLNGVFSTTDDHDLVNPGSDDLQYVYFASQETGPSFRITSATSSQTDVDMLLWGGTPTAAPIAFDGYLIGYAVWLDAAITAGTITIAPVVNGTKLAAGFQKAITSGQTEQMFFNPYQHAASAGHAISAHDRFGIKYTTDASFAASNPVEVWVTPIFYNDKRAA